MGARKTARERGRAARIATETELESELELRRLGDDVLDGYLAWREQSAAVAVASAGWQRATRSDRAAAFAAYLAALDHEEEAAIQYEHLLELTARRLSNDSGSATTTPRA